MGDRLGQSELEGTGAPLSWAGAGLPIPNHLGLWLDRLGDFSPVVQVQVKGEAYPRAAWESQRQRQAERIVLTDEGYGETHTVWESVERVEVFGLPPGARLRGYALRLGLPREPDLDRPYFDTAYRDQPFLRFWLPEGLLLKEVYQRNHFSGWTTSSLTCCPKP